MVERFNFYDVYAYLLPGLVLIGLVLLPVAVTGGSLPSASFGTAVGCAVLAYVLGHLLHPLAKASFPSAPQAQTLLAGGQGLSEWVRGRVRALLGERFDLRWADTEDPPRDAFHLCRGAVVRAGASRYLEQWQGLYSAMRNAAAACLFGASCALGWTVGLLARLTGIPAALAVAIAAASPVLLARTAGAFPSWTDLCRKLFAEGRWRFSLFAFALAAFGVLGAQGRAVASDRVAVLAGAVVLLLVTHRIFVKGYLTHSEHFAREVFMSFLVVEGRREPSAPGS